MDDFIQEVHTNSRSFGQRPVIEPAFYTRRCILWYYVISYNER
jgi:hypothetical protein